MTIQDRKRIIADIGKLLTDGTRKVRVADINPDEVQNWNEVDDPNYVMMNRPEGGSK